MNMLEIELIRHVKVAGKPALYGKTDIAPLAAENHRLLEQLICQQKTSKAYHSIICSPLKRCQSVAKQFSLLCKLPLEVCADLQEMHFGIFDGLPFDDIPVEDVIEESPLSTKAHQEKNHEIHWSLLEGFFQAPATADLPKGERLGEFNERVIKAWGNLVEQQLIAVSEQRARDLQIKVKQPTNRRVLVVAHGGVIRMIIAHILQLDWKKSSWHQQLQIGNASLTRINLSQPYDNNEVLQQITTIATPFLQEH